MVYLTEICTWFFSATTNIVIIDISYFFTEMYIVDTDQNQLKADSDQ